MQKTLASSEHHSTDPPPPLPSLSRRRQHAVIVNLNDYREYHELHYRCGRGGTMSSPA
eukprot:COSAG01_NODE_5848_length_3996_cov_37.085964_7_plen_58_part_00